jgi:hypothetical protein
LDKTGRQLSWSLWHFRLDLLGDGDQAAQDFVIESERHLQMALHLTSTASPGAIHLPSGGVKPWIQNSLGQLVFTRAASTTGSAAKNQIPISICG